MKKNEFYDGLRELTMCALLLALVGGALYGLKLLTR